MRTIKVADWEEIPENYTGIAEIGNGTKEWYKNENRHREDGPAIKYKDGTKEWWLEDKEYFPKNLNDYVVLDSYQGNYNLMWYKLLDENEIIEYPDILGLITKWKR